MIKSNKKLAIYMEGALETENGKMGLGVMRYSLNPIMCAIDSRYAGQTVREAVGQPFDYPVVSSVAEAHAMACEVLVLGIAPSGGKFPDAWDKPVKDSLASGMSLINGLHDDLNARFGHLLNTGNPDQVIWDVRKPKKNYSIASAQAAQLKNTRVLLIGTDMAVGKMTTGLELYRWFKNQGFSADFLATGQIGITVTGKGIPLDAIKVDQACGAVEDLVMSAKDRDFVFIEGQGSLLHPGSTATLPLMRGSCATHLILCHRAKMNTLFDHPHIKVPPLDEFITLNEAVAAACGSLTKATCIGVALNTFGMSTEEADHKIAEIENETGLTTTDVIRYGPDKLAKVLLEKVG
ncbi:MAG: DUF1611 domain-containing protein [Saprospiraceae bacterium]|nr:DUF1611 domain-containing protein [Saprospiraceae bacterium]